MGRKIEIVTWSSTFSVDVKLIDDQHRGLINLINDMFNHVSGNYDEEQAYFNAVIQKAVQYVKIHFKTEERIMLATKFPGYKEHKKAHDTFVVTVVETVRSFESGNKLILVDFTKFLKD